MLCHVLLAFLSLAAGYVVRLPSTRPTLQYGAASPGLRMCQTSPVKAEANTDATVTGNSDSSDSNAPPSPEATATYGPDSSLDRRIFCNRALNMGQIQAVGFDLDYTLAEYRTDFDLLAYDGAVRKLLAMGYPEEVKMFKYDAKRYQRGLLIDKQRGNVLKLDRHKYVKVCLQGNCKAAPLCLQPYGCGHAPPARSPIMGYPSSSRQSERPSMRVPSKRSPPSRRRTMHPSTPTSYSWTCVCFASWSTSKIGSPSSCRSHMPRFTSRWRGATEAPPQMSFYRRHDGGD